MPGQSRTAFRLRPGTASFTLLLGALVSLQIFGITITLPILPTITAELDATPGGTFSVDIDGNPIRGEYLVVDPHRRVVVTWGLLGSDILPVGSTQVEFVLTPTDAGTRLDLTHSDLPVDQVPPHAEGWPHFLGILAARLAPPG